MTTNRDAIGRARAAKESGGLRRSVAHYGRPRGRDLLGRTERFLEWHDARSTNRLWPYSRALQGQPLTRTGMAYEDGTAFEGLNFASQDYLSLSSHARVVDAAREALRRFGPHSAGSPVLLGNTPPTLALESKLADLLQMEQVTLFPTGWGAGFGTITGLVRRNDFIVMDELAHACLQSGANAATDNVVRHAHLDVGAVRQHLAEIRAGHRDAAVLVITEGLFSMDSDVPDLRALQEACREFEATLLVDVAHDLGSMGPGGTGQLGQQGLLGEVDLVMGSFSKTFASNGGFLACNSRAVKHFLKFYGGPHIFSNALSPVQAATVAEALDIVRSREGGDLRLDLLRAVHALRGSFARRGITCIGGPSAIVPVPLGSEAVARLACATLFDRGVFVNLVEYPAVAVGSARFRMQVMAKHTESDAETAARTIVEAVEEARALRDAIESEDETESRRSAKVEAAS